jgi:tartrate dehydrogenase/decarboxylase/D-malate dehydrogenase
MSRTNRVYRIAAIAGDGIGKEVMPEGLRVLEAAAKKYGFELQLDEFDFSSCDYYAKHGKMLPDDWKAQIGSHDAIFFGAVGWPSQVPDHISLWGSLLLFRREFDQYVNLRPVRLMPGVPVARWSAASRATSTSSSCARTPRANTPRSAGACSRHRARDRHAGDDHEPRRRRPRAEIRLRAGAARPRKKLTSATKSNGISITMPYWDERVKEMAKNYPDVRSTSTTSTSSPRISC